MWGKRLQKLSYTYPFIWSSCRYHYSVLPYKLVPFYPVMFPCFVLIVEASSHSPMCLNGEMVCVLVPHSKGGWFEPSWRRPSQRTVEICYLDSSEQKRPSGVTLTTSLSNVLSGQGKYEHLHYILLVSPCNEKATFTL